MNEYCMAVFRSGIQGDTLAHHGILGMRWGIRRFQPYGQGYDADHEGREVGLAARMGGHGGSFSSSYGRDRSLGSKARTAATIFGKKAKRAAKEAAERAGYGAKKVGKAVSRGLDAMNEQHDRFSAALKRKTDPYAEQGKAFAKRFASGAKTRLGDVSDAAVDAGYRLVTSKGFSSAFNATLGRSSALKRGMSNLAAVAALRSGITTADKRRRAEGPTSSLGGKSLNWGVMGDRSKVQSLDDQRLYGKTEFEKFRDRQAGALGKTVIRGGLASRQTGFSPRGDYATIDDWFETFSASPKLSRALGIDKTRADAMARGVMLSPMSALSGRSHSENMRSLAEGRRMVESSDFLSSGAYQDVYGYKFLTRSQEQKLPRM